VIAFVYIGFEECRVVVKDDNGSVVLDQILSDSASDYDLSSDFKYKADYGVVQVVDGSLKNMRNVIFNVSHPYVSYLSAFYQVS